MYDDKLCIIIASISIWVAMNEFHKAKRYRRRPHQPRILDISIVIV